MKKIKTNTKIWKNKKAAHVFMLILLGITIIAFASLIGILNIKLGHVKPLGEAPITIFKAVHEGEDILNYVDEGAKHAVRQAEFDLAMQGGVLTSGCGNLNGINYWYKDGKLCMPKQYKEDFKQILSQNLNVGYYIKTSGLDIPTNNYAIKILPNKVLGLAKKEIVIDGTRVEVPTTFSYNVESTNAAIEKDKLEQTKTPSSNLITENKEQGKENIILLGQECQITNFILDSESLWYNNAGGIKNAAMIEESTEYYYNPNYHRNKFYGTIEMVNMLEKASCITKELTGARTRIHDLSAKQGGKIGHRSHQNGRDVDTGILKNSGGKITSVFKNLNGSKIDLFDAKANWIFLKAIYLSANIEMIGTDKEFIDKLKSYTEQNEPDKELAANIIKKLSYWKGHADHYHIRIYCSPEDKMCKDGSAKSSEKAYWKNQVEEYLET